MEAGEGEHIFSRLTKVSCMNRLTTISTSSSINSSVGSINEGDMLPPPCKLDFGLSTNFFILRSGSPIFWSHHCLIPRILFFGAHFSLFDMLQTLLNQQIQIFFFAQIKHHEGFVDFSLARLTHQVKLT
jgi:hypothetical protein